MENHDFSDPLPYPQGSIQPCWKVHVYRRGVPEPVASLEVHAQSLPPRLGKKSKVLWKLPDRLEDTPHFGGLEKERLWQLFKREKKNRRKSNKQQQPPQLPPPTATSDADAAPTSSSLEKDPKKPPRPPQEVQEESDQVADNNNDDDDKPDSPSSSSALPPPPGFGRGQASPHDDPKDEPDGANPPSPAATTPSSSTATAASAAAPPGLSSPDAAASAATTAPPPPPPPPGLSSPPPPSAPPSSSGFVFGSLQGSDIVTLPHHVLAQVIGHVLAQFFISCLTTPGHLAQWLAKYHASALKLLLFGTAQAQAQTPADRQQQWESLLYNPHPHHNNNNSNTSTGESSSQQAAAAPPITTTTTTMTPWDCQGWAVQPLLSPPPQSSSLLEGLLVVLTGRTVQQGEVLTYHLTLTLRPLTTTMSGGGGGTPFHITNEILSLTRATPPSSSS